MLPRLIFIAHGDHNFNTLSCKQTAKGWLGHMDNLAGMYVLLSAYFKGKLGKNTDLQFTNGQEKAYKINEQWVNFIGARSLMKQLKQNDLIVVVDVTTIHKQHINTKVTIQKCKQVQLSKFLDKALKGLDFQIFQQTPDFVCNQDQTDVFRQKFKNVVFLGVIVSGGDYNEGPVILERQCFQTAVQAVSRISRMFDQCWWQYLQNSQSLSIQQKKNNEIRLLIKDIRCGGQSWREQREKIQWSQQFIYFQLTQSDEKNLQQIVQSTQTLQLFQSYGPNKVLFVRFNLQNPLQIESKVPLELKGQVNWIQKCQNGYVLSIYQERLKYFILNIQIQYSP